MNKIEEFKRAINELVNKLRDWVTMQNMQYYGREL